MKGFVLHEVIREGIQALRLLAFVDSRVVLGAVSKGRSSSRTRKKLIECWCAPLPKFRSPRTAVFASAHAPSELDLLREPLSAPTEKHVRKLESSGGFSCSKMNPAFVKSETSQMTYLDESHCTPSYARQCSLEGKN